MGAIVIVDAFWGDAGKGKFSAYLSRLHNAALCVRAGVGPNAGHSIRVDGQWIRNRLVPLGFTNPSTKLAIGAGVAVDPVLLQQEVRQTRTDRRLVVDYRCPVIEPRHIARERRDPVMKAIDSTKTGSGAARADYVMRRGRRACDVPELRPYCRDVAMLCNQAALKGTVVVEGSQATYLSLYLSNRYPFTSSDNCTTAAFVDDVGLNWRLVDRVVLLVKCLPTAVGNGPLPHEMPAEEIARKGLQEFGTNTGRPRRRSRRLDFSLLRYSVMLNGPTEIALTWCDQFDRRIEGATKKRHITKKIGGLIERVEKVCGVPVRFLETGKDFDNIIALY
jgi:adenylosuccinate synthase